MRKEIKDHISWTYGPSAWEEVLQIEGQMRKIRQDEMYKKQELFDNIVSGVLIGLLIISGVGALFLVLSFINARQGKY
jgi:hypothetical protein